MKVKKLFSLLSGMPEDATVVICVDPNIPFREIPQSKYQPIDIAAVLYDYEDNTVELRERW